MVPAAHRLFLASLLMLLPAAVCLVAGPAAFARLGPQEGEFPLPRGFLIYVRNKDAWTALRQMHSMFHVLFPWPPS